MIATVAPWTNSGSKFVIATPGSMAVDAAFSAYVSVAFVASIERWKTPKAT